MIHQNFPQWQQAPQQGAIVPRQPDPGVTTTADEIYLTETLIECRVKLQSALATSKRYSKLSELHQAIGDAFTGCDEALKILADLEAHID